jgi:hypothetical protein
MKTKKALQATARAQKRCMKTSSEAVEVRKDQDV